MKANRHHHHRRAQRGFTIIELVIVLVILGVIAAIAVPQFADLGDAADRTAAQTWASNINSATAANYGEGRLAESGTGDAVDVTECSEDQFYALFAEFDEGDDLLEAIGGNAAFADGTDPAPGDADSNGDVFNCTLDVDALDEAIEFSVTYFDAD